MRLVCYTPAVKTPLTATIVGVALAAGPIRAQEPKAQTGRPARVTHHPLAEGTRFATRYTVIQSAVAGPTVMVVGGIHGDEPAGSFAALQIAGWSIEKGKLVVIQRANELALRAKTRRTPDLPKTESDLNRQFPRVAGGEPVGVLAAALWGLIQTTAPDYLLVLQEGYDFTQTNPKSAGSSIILGAKSSGRRAALAMLGAVNQTIEDAKKEFVLKGPAVAGSLARAAADRLAIPSMILLTTTRNQARAYRVRQHRLAAHNLLAKIGMLTHSPHQMAGAPARQSTIKVGVYATGGVGLKGLIQLDRLLTPEHGFTLRRVCGADIRDGSLAQFDVAVFPGGSMRGQAKSLQTTGLDAVRTYVRGGGNFVGICAGAYLASNNYDVSLHILDADVIDRKHWARGRGEVPVEFTAKAASRLGISKPRHSMYYANGPIYQASGDPELPDFQVLARFRGEVTKEGVPGGVMPGTPAIVLSKYGAGRVLCSSAHPELTQGLDEMLRQLIRTAAGR